MAGVELKKVTIITAASEEAIRRANQPLDPVELTIEGQDAVRAHWANDPPQPMPSSIEVVIAPPKNRKN